MSAMSEAFQLAYDGEAGKALAMLQACDTGTLRKVSGAGEEVAFAAGMLLTERERNE